MGLSGYDTLIASLIPGYTSLARLSVSLLAASPMAGVQGASVLVAGCGSGAELLAARQLRPDWHLTALDPSEDMLAMAREKLQLHPSIPDGQGPIQWVQGTVETLSGDPVFDGAMAVLVLQGLPDDGSKRRFLSSLSQSLRPGAQVVLVDQMLPERSSIDQQLITARQVFQRTETAVPVAEPDEILGNVYPLSLSRLTGLLEVTGFSDPCPVFRALDYEGFLVQRLP
ncbi:MAG: class I SAM-dependent methyltransferase [Cyanobacteriota bacterium]|jgi:tRNA (cmo5U34)-methyltransferase|nr:class I SAM-dependent methyltransferase [Cyanobacteriota bacterium]